MNATSFIYATTKFYKLLFVAFKLAHDIKKHIPRVTDTYMKATPIY